MIIYFYSKYYSYWWETGEAKKNFRFLVKKIIRLVWNQRQNRTERKNMALDLRYSTVVLSQFRRVHVGIEIEVVWELWMFCLFQSPANRPKWNAVSKNKSVNSVYNPEISHINTVEIFAEQKRTLWIYKNDFFFYVSIVLLDTFYIINKINPHWELILSLLVSLQRRVYWNSLDIDRLAIVRVDNRLLVEENHRLR